MTTSAQYKSLPFDEAIDFFRQKTAMPTEAWDDLEKEMHARAFVVAGATKTELLTDLRRAVDKSIAEGGTLAMFQKDFDSIVDRHGWNYKGNRGWRSATILDTNISMAYSAGRYKQMTSPAVAQARPYFRYLPSSSRRKRADHVRFYNLVLPQTDPFWVTHFPPNGWGCHCGVTTVSGRELEKLQLEEHAYPISQTSPTLKETEYVKKSTGEVKAVKEGCDPGFDYNPGVAAWGKQLSQDAFAGFKALGKDAFEDLSVGNWQSYGLAENLIARDTSTAIGPKLTDQSLVAPAIADLIGAEEKVFSFGKDAFRYDLLVNAEVLGDHFNIDRTPYLPFVPEVLTDPDEAWISFEKHNGTGKVQLRMRIVRAIKARGDRVLLVVADARGGWLTAWTVIPVSTKKKTYINKQRQGVLAYTRK
jgi:hypothetical protein